MKGSADDLKFWKKDKRNCRNFSLSFLLSRNIGSIKDDSYSTSRENSFELIELSGINIVSLVLV